MPDSRPPCPPCRLQKATRRAQFAEDTCEQRRCPRQFRSMACAGRAIERTWTSRDVSPW